MPSDALQPLLPLRLSDTRHKSSNGEKNGTMVTVTNRDWFNLKSPGGLWTTGVRSVGLFLNRKNLRPFHIRTRFHSHYCQVDFFFLLFKQTHFGGCAKPNIDGSLANLLLLVSWNLKHPPPTTQPGRNWPDVQSRLHFMQQADYFPLPLTTLLFEDCPFYS